MKIHIPHFFIVGAPKCGTTSLYEWLRTHPDIYAPQKEPCFFSQDIFPTQGLRTHIPSLEAYSNIFSEGFERGKIVGEATPKYLYSDQAISEIAKLRPNAKIIVCLRDPVDLAVSLHSQKVREAVELTSDFNTAWARSEGPGIRRSGALLPEVRGQINYAFWASVGVRLEYLHQMFPPESILIILLSDMKSAPRKVYLDVLRFIGVEDDGRVDFAALNERVRVRSLKIQRLLNGVRAFCEPTISLLLKFRDGKGLGVIKLITKLNLQRGRYSSSISPRLRQELYTYLAADISLANSYLDGRDICSDGDSPGEDIS